MPSQRLDLVGTSLIYASSTMPDPFSNQNQYAAAANIPLIKSPALRFPRPVELPPDVHPLPESVSAYFVYPFSLEIHILTLESSRRKTFAAHAARREAYLKARLAENERRKRDALRRIAPGFEPQSTPLVPTRVASTGSPTDGSHPAPPLVGATSQVQTESVMYDLVDQLAALDYTKR
ncbi:hypothetical protein BJ322DRAFT_1048445 [Thelephora terrestris]|uniref:Uncharacterized protein n=1 Tax=Thelephora terrestris TaxID=56493 RepID=A0A9P6HMB1_9AGAM|nr:hypothetical protein BJ322DRAFT_1048445 [Thelephora terrestris]